MRLSEVYQQKKTVLSFEIFPPKRDTTLTSIDETLEVLCGLKPEQKSLLRFFRRSGS